MLAVTSPTLQTLRLRGCTAVGGSSWSFHVKAFGVDGPPQLPQLRHVDFSHTDATDALVGALLRRAPRLECAPPPAPLAAFEEPSRALPEPFPEPSVPRHFPDTSLSVSLNFLGKLGDTSLTLPGHFLDPSGA